jgi:NADPH2:quinone reductase
VLGFGRSGALADYICVPPAALRLMPEGMPFVVAASFHTNYLTALYALSERAYAKPDEALLVLGAAGGVGIAAVQIGKLMGLRVIAAASTEEKRSFAKSHGADATIDYTKPGWRDDIKALTGDRGVDVVYDPIGGDIGLLAFRALAWRGRHLVIGFAGGPIPALPFNLPLLKGAALIGVDVAQIARREPDVEARVIDKLFSWIIDGTLKPVVGQVFDIADFRRAFQAMTERKAIGKVVVTMA